MMEWKVVTLQHSNFVAPLCWNCRRDRHRQTNKQKYALRHRHDVAICAFAKQTFKSALRIIEGICNTPEVFYGTPLFKRSKSLYIKDALVSIV